MRFTIVSIFFILLSIKNTYADHIGQVDIRYEFNGVNYTVYLTLYKECTNNPNNLVSFGNSFGVLFSSKTLNTQFNRYITVKSKDTLDLSCLNAIDICHSVTGTIFGYEKWVFYDTVSIPPAPDWVIGLETCCTLNMYNNIGYYQPVYTETTLDNSGINNNSSAILPPSNLFFLTPNDTVYYPLSSTDIDNDSISYEVVEQKGNILGMTIPYASGYSKTEPLGVGQLCKIDSIRNQLVLYNSNRGLYALSLKVNEYRNSKLISHQTRLLALRFNINTSSRTNTYPFPANNANLAITTCPGKANSVMLSFLDSTATDIVDVDVITPNMPGWTFNKTITPGAGRADVQLSWNTPLNLTTLPQFFITLHAKDNECPNNTIDYVLAVKTDSCTADSVWPGDANDDNVVDMYDALAIALAHSETGAARTSPNTLWQPQTCASWGRVFPVDNTDMKHADCNGNGTTDNADLAAITNNYGNTHGRKKNLPVAIASTTNAPLFLDTAGIVFEAGKTLQIPIVLGTGAAQLQAAYGIATTIDADTFALAAPLSISTTSSWLGAASNIISFSKNTRSSAIDWAHARITHTNYSGYGPIGILTLAIPAGTPDNTPLNISFKNTRIIDNQGRQITTTNIKGINTTVKNKLGVGQSNTIITAASIVPNPSAQKATLIVKLKTNATLRTDIADITGRTVWTYQSNATDAIALPAQQLQSGIYFVKLTTANGETLTLKWVKE